VGRKEELSDKWAKLKDEQREAIMVYIPRYKQAKPDKSFRKDPQTFLDNESWNNEIVVAQPKRIGYDSTPPNVKMAYPKCNPMHN